MTPSSILLGASILLFLGLGLAFLVFFIFHFSSRRKLTSSSPNKNIELVPQVGDCYPIAKPEYAVLSANAK